MSNINRFLKIIIDSLGIMLSCLSDLAEETDLIPHSTKYTSEDLSPPQNLIDMIKLCLDYQLLF